ncbi:MAG: ribbon-helix-helix protein, CopG family [bacterium]|nr:ribbon-helix-helix protein, CopG family [bacterium]
MSEMMSVSLDSEMNHRLEQLARVTSMSKTNLVLDALREYLDVREWQIEAIREGIRQADDGQLIPHEDIRKKWETKLACTMD